MAEVQKILLVEDDAPIAELLGDSLERSGFEVKKVARGQRALQYLALCDDISLLVLDYRLPDMTGADIVAAMGDEINFLPVVVVTGNPDPEVERAMRAAGVRDYIVKDIDMRFLDSLPQAARKALN